MAKAKKSLASELPTLSIKSAAWQAHPEFRTHMATIVASGRWPQVCLIQSRDPLLAKEAAVQAIGSHYCESKQFCGTCAACLALVHHRFGDVWWSETDETTVKIPEAHAICEHITVLPESGSPHRAAVLIDADKLNPSSANALLKSLEEAPASALLVLTTAKPRLVLQTILSRCVSFKLPAYMEELKDTLAEAEDVALRELLAANGAKELLDHAEHCTKVLGLSAFELYEKVERVLNKTYRGIHTHSSLDPASVRERRGHLQTLKKLAVAKKIALNAQLCAEALVLR